MRRLTLLILELLRLLVIGPLIQGAALWISREIEDLIFPHLPHVLLEVLLPVFTNEAISKGAEQLNLVLIFLQHHLLMKSKEDREIWQ